MRKREGRRGRGKNEKKERGREGETGKEGERERGEGEGSWQRETLIYLKELAHTVMRAGRPEICRAGQQAGDLGNN